jgi:tRNA threonylcarbamoyladenosine biosynthesis protein TsaB
MLLAVDTSTQWIGLALYDGAQVLNETVWRSHSHHTVELAPALDTLFKTTAVRPEGLQALGVALGPGSFTSLRIGLAVVKGLALSLHLPVVGIPTLDILAASQPVQDLPLAAILQAGRGRLAVEWYSPEENRWKPQGEAQISRIEDLVSGIRKPTLVAGELNAEERHLLARKRKNVILASPAQSMRRPSVLAELAWKRWQMGEVDDPATLSPTYLQLGEPIPG